MRLIDADDLLERFVYADVKTELVNAAHDIIEAAPTIRCADCVHFRLVVRFAHGFITTGLSHPGILSFGSAQYRQSPQSSRGAVNRSPYGFAMKFEQP